MKSIYQVSKLYPLQNKLEQFETFETFKKLKDLLEEKSLAYNAKNIDFLLKNHKESTVLIKKALKAKDTLFMTNQGQVVKLAKSYANARVSKEELIQQGNVGIAKALLRYETSRQTKFSSYARFWIYALIMQALATTEDIYVPASAKKKLGTVIRYLNFEDNIGKLASLPETSLYDNVFEKTTNVEKEVLKRALNLDGNCGALSLALFLGCTLDEAEDRKTKLIQRLYHEL